MVRSRATAVLCAVSLALAACASTAPIEPSQAFRSKLEEAVRDGGAPGVTALVMKDGRLLYRVDAGEIAPDASFPIASATKWLTAALVMTVVDEGKLNLDEPIGRRLPEFTGEAAQITPRQLLSYTAGQGGLRDRFDINQDRLITLAEASRQIAARPLEDSPGTVYRYGGPSFQVLGALVEQATGRRWSDLFAERIGGPLGMTRTFWGNPDHAIKPDRVLNPLLQGGVHTTAEDYARFLTMIAGGGVYEGRRILSPAALRTMESAQTLNVRINAIPPGMQPGVHYALGHWCEAWEASGRCTMLSSPGAFGVYPWVDRRSGLYGLFFTRHRLPDVSNRFREARRIAIEEAGLRR